MSDTDEHRWDLSKKHWAKALEWVERGIGIERGRDWKNESSYSLERLRPEILRKLGRKQDALASAWAGFQQDPSFADRAQEQWRSLASCWPWSLLDAS